MSTAFLLSRLLSLKSDYNFYALQEALMNNKYTSIQAQVAAIEGRQENWNECYEDVLENDGTYEIDGTIYQFHEIDDDHPNAAQATEYLAEAYANQSCGNINELADQLEELSILDTLYQQKQTFYDTNMTETKAFMDSLKGILQQSASDVPAGGGS